MVRPSNRRADPGGLGTEAILVWLGLGLIFLLTSTVYVAQHIGHRLVDDAVVVPGGPAEVLFSTLKGQTPWASPASTVAAVLWLVLLSGLVAVGVWVWLRGASKRTRADRQSRVLGRGREIEPMTRAYTQGVADRLGVATPGLPRGVSVRTGEPLFSDWEGTRICIAGPRVGKTTSIVVPEILAAPGAVLTTSNKRDAVDATRDVRAAVGPVWIFDPQGVAAEPPGLWWNPLTYVTDEVQASKLAQHFAAGSREAGAKTDAFFEPAGQDLLAGLLLAAALESRPITDVYKWLTRPSDDEPIEILSRRNFPLTAAQVEGVVNAPERQRGGIYGTAQQMASCLTNRQALQWVTPPSSPGIPHFDVDDFVRSTGTLYSLSKEGRGTFGPLVTALTVAVVEAAERLGVASPGGRLPVPLVVCLDEASNVCRWSDLPDGYSHFSSRGIIVDTVLQSWSQGVDVWGETGMRKLWSASNFKVYGGNVSEVGFLKDLSDLIGDYDRQSSSTSYRRGERTISHQLHRERIFDVAELASLPKGRAIVLASGARPTLVRTVPWMAGPHAAAVQASIAAHDPAASETLSEHTQTAEPGPVWSAEKGWSA